MLSRLLQAARCAISNDAFDKREALIGAVGERADGAIVYSRNTAVFDSECANTNVPTPFQPAHAEWKLAKKLDTGATVYVARVRKDGSLAMSRPCPGCERVLRSRKVMRVFYTINPTSYGIWNLITNVERVIEKTELIPYAH